MIVTRAFPPNYAKPRQAFGVHAPQVIYCYGDTIYNPAGGALTEALFAHEGVHSRRQGKDPETWWDRYIADRQFRFDEELLAHREEYRVATDGAGRHERRKWATLLANRLSGPLYGNVVSTRLAKVLIGASAVAVAA